MFISNIILFCDAISERGAMLSVWLLLLLFIFFSHFSHAIKLSDSNQTRETETEKKKQRNDKNKITGPMADCNFCESGGQTTCSVTDE